MHKEEQFPTNILVPLLSKCNIIPVKTFVPIYMVHILFEYICFLQCSHQQSSFVSVEMDLSHKLEQIIFVVIKTCTVII